MGRLDRSPIGSNPVFPTKKDMVLARLIGESGRVVAPVIEFDSHLHPKLRDVVFNGLAQVLWAHLDSVRIRASRPI